MKKLDPNFTDFLRLLNEHRVEYVVIGGYAVGYHGFVRATGDIDLFIGISAENAKSLVEVFAAFGFSSSEIQEQLFLEAGKIVRIGLPPLRIEIMNDISGVTFDEIFPKRIEENIDGLRVPFIDLDSLLKNKAASRRMKDLADIEELTKRKPRRR